MKLKNKLVPIIGLVSASSFIPAVLTLSSCSEVLAQGTWDVKNGGLDQYDKNINRPNIKAEDTPSGEGLDWRKATDLYFDAVEKDHNIFVNDVLYSLSHNMREFAYNFSYEETWIKKEVIYDVFGMGIYNYKCTNVTVKLYKWDTVTHRISFDIDMKVESQNPEFIASGWCKFRWHNHPAALAHEDVYWTDQQEIYPEGGWTLCPEAFARYWYGELGSIAEVVDPRYPMGGGASHLIMTAYDDWYMQVDEHYDLPFGRRTAPDQTFDNHCVYNNAFLKALTTSVSDDPEAFAQVKYWFAFHYINAIHYMDDVAASAHL